MGVRALCWLAVAVALSVCRDALGDFAIWPACSASNRYRIVKRGVADPVVTWLNLDRCDIISLKQNELDYSNLETLSLKDNNIEFFETGVFDSLASMKILYLNSIRILGKDLPSSLFRNCHRLTYIQFDSNDMSDTPTDLLQGLINLQDLHCDNCSLHKMPTFITRWRLPIRQIFLDSNQLMRLDDPVTFVNLGNLIYLGLKSNKIDYLHEDLFKPLTEIKNIDMRSNKIRRIPERLFQNKPQLEYISLAENLIDYIPEKAFLGTRLITLNLSENRLVYLQENFFSELHSSAVELHYFHFDGNPWSCACLNELLIKVKQLNIVYGGYKYNGKHKSCIISDSFKCNRLNIYQELYDKLISDGN